VVLVATTAAQAAGSNASATTPDPGATTGVASAVQTRLGTPAELYANCPTENTFPDQSGALLFSCEFRAVINNRVNAGTTTAKPVPGGYEVGKLFVARPTVDAWRKCGRGAAGGRKLGAEGTKKIRTHGVACRYMDQLAGDVRGNASRKKLRIKPHFLAGGHGTNTLGFQVFLYRCRGKNLARHGGNPASRILEARCINPFGDGFVYRFELTGFMRHPQRGGSGRGGSNCTPGYSPCITEGSDVDCAGGSGNGPRFVQGPVTVTGSDPYGLDADGDGIGCES
jgi:hypothetical protein